MLLINKLTEPGGIKRVELRPSSILIVLRDGTERVYTNNQPGHGEQTGEGAREKRGQLYKPYPFG